MTAPDLNYREARRNAPRRVAVLGARRRVRLPSMVDTEIGARLYDGDMCTMSTPIAGSLGSEWAAAATDGPLLAATADPLFLFPNPGFGRLP